MTRSQTTLAPWAADRGGAAREAAPPRRQRGATLLELLVALGVVVALAALALPWMWSRLAAFEGPEAAERVCGLLRLARAEAISTGRLVQVIYTPSERGEGGELRAEFIEPESLASGDRAPRGAIDRLAERPEFESEGLSQQTGAGARRATQREAPPLAASWASLRLPPGWQLLRASPREATAEPPSEEDGFFDRPDFDAEVEEEPGDAWAEEGREGGAEIVALYLPDGRNLLVGGWVLARSEPGEPQGGSAGIAIDLEDLFGLPRAGARR